MNAPQKPTNVIGTRPSVLIRMEVTFASVAVDLNKTLSSSAKVQIILHFNIQAYPLPYNEMPGNDSGISIEI